MLVHWPAKNANNIIVCLSSIRRYRYSRKIPFCKLAQKHTHIKKSRLVSFHNNRQRLEIIVCENHCEKTMIVIYGGILDLAIRNGNTLHSCLHSHQVYLIKIETPKNAGKKRRIIRTQNKQNMENSRDRNLQRNIIIINAGSKQNNTQTNAYLKSAILATTISLQLIF